VICSNELGREAEDFAVKFLMKNNFQILERNWRSGKAEIDVIATKDKKIHIIEVKARTSDRVLSPEEAVNTKKIKLLMYAADAYVCRLDQDFDIQFDIISILHRNSRFHLKYIEDAFNSVYQ